MNQDIAASGSKTGCGCTGCATLLVAVLFIPALIAGVWYGADVHGTQMLHAGDESRFDPIASLGYAKALAGPDLKFLQMTARFVKADGTLDLTEDYEPDVLYQWVGDDPGADRRPIGAGGGGTTVRVVSVRATNLGFRPGGTTPTGGQRYDLNLGLRRWEGTLPVSKFLVPTTPPSCSLKKLWKHALKAGAPKSAVATIHYNSRGYSFEIADTDFQLQFSRDCTPR